MEHKPIPGTKFQDCEHPDVKIIELTSDGNEKACPYPPSQNPLPTHLHSTVPYHQQQYQPSQPPPEWPLSQKVYVATLTPWRTTVLVFDFLLASTPIVFIVLAVLAVDYNEETPTSNGERLIQVLQFCPTIFPVIFAALMGRFFHSLGLYLAERGTTLGRLENFIGAQSIASALERLVCLRSWSFLSFMTVLAWLPSPFGGQAALRVLVYNERGHEYRNETMFQYLDPLKLQDSDLATMPYSEPSHNLLSSIFLTSILMSQSYRWRPEDPWWNVKLPRYRTIEANSTSEWKSTSNYDSYYYSPWSSFIGIPVNNTEDVHDSEYFIFNWSQSYNIMARQFDIECSSNQRMSLSESNFGDTNATWKLDFADPVLGCPTYPCSIISKSLAPANETDADDYMVSVAHCNVSFEHLEAKVVCKNDDFECMTERVRKLDLFADGYNLTLDNSIRSNVMRQLMSTLPRSENYGNIGRGSTIMERWMADSSNFIQPTHKKVALWNLTAEYFSEGLTMLWNSYFQASYVSSAIDISTRYSTGNSQEENGSTKYINTKASLIFSIGMYQLNWKWFGVLLACSIFLLAAGYIGLVLKYKTNAPDIVGYASSLTLLNPYVPTPTGGTTLDGLERTALLHNLPVKIGDVCPNNPVGVIAMAKADEGGVGNLERKRLYM